MADISNRVAVNKTAALVVGSGFHYEPNKKIQNNDSDMPLPIVKMTKEIKSQSSFVDFTGLRFGRFVVLGIARDYKSSWVVRCACGKYTTRRAKAIENPSNDHDRCEHCRHLAHLKRTDHWKQTGKDKDIREF